MAISARTRFEIFKRDNFKCVYCGVTPMKAFLHVDHVKPKKEGGTDEPHNLVTSCRDCNLGKSAIPLEKRKFKAKASEEDREHLEQLKEYLAHQKEMHEAKTDIQETALLHWQDRVGDITKQLPSIMAGALGEFGLDEVIEAIDIVGRKGDLRRPVDQVRYLCGIFRRKRNGEAIVSQKSKQESAADALREAQWKIVDNIFCAYWHHRGRSGTPFVPILPAIQKAREADLGWGAVFTAIDLTEIYIQDAETAFAEKLASFSVSGLPEEDLVVQTFKEQETERKSEAMSMLWCAWGRFVSSRPVTYDDCARDYPLVAEWFSQLYELYGHGQAALHLLLEAGSSLDGKTDAEQQKLLRDVTRADKHMSQEWRLTEKWDAE